MAKQSHRTRRARPPRGQQRQRRARPLSGQFHCHLVIMAKEPVMGAVKTRLAQEIGPVAATFFYRHAARAVMMRLSRDKRWRTHLAMAPDGAIATRAWPAGMARMGQGRGGLGQRMSRIFDMALRGPVVIVGTDIPRIDPALIAQAFRQLGPNDAVFGPADDGGYWLVGLSRVPRVLPVFDSVRWSSRDALADTLTNLAAHRVGFAAVLSDVDDAADFRRQRGWAGRVVLPALP